MKWVTRDFVHLDRVAAPWLIRRFIDPEAQFVFVPTLGGPHPLPDDAIPFGLPGVEISAHDANGSTFRKLLVRHGLQDDGALGLMATLIEDGIAWFLHEKLGQGAVRPDAMPEAPGLVALSEGMMLATAGDAENIAASLTLYDAVYAFCQARLMLAGDPQLNRLAPPRLIPVIKERLSQAPYRNRDDESQ